MFSRLLRQLIRVAADRRGGVSVMLALMLVPLVAVMGLATETASWYLFQRAAQNAADAAALAAAINRCDTASTCKTATYKDEAKAVGARYNFSADAYTTVLPDTVACPGDPTVTCYRVTITKQMPVILTRIVGYNGTNSSGYQTISAVSVAKPKGNINNGYCLVVGSGGITGKGANSADFGGCNSYSRGDVNCNGGKNLGLGISYAPSGVGNSGCGTSQEVLAVPSNLDTFKDLATSSNIPTSNNCPFASGAKLNTLNLSLYTAAHPMVCTGDIILGDLFTSGSQVTTASGGSVIVIRGGNLDLAGQTLNANGLTVIFTPSTTTTTTHIDACSGKKCNNGSPNCTGSGNNTQCPAYDQVTSTTQPAGFVADDSGTINITAPSSGTWSGIAVYQDPNAATSTYTYAGNTPHFNITGLIYMPQVSLTMKGNIDFSSLKCISLFVYGLDVRGGTNIFPGDVTSQCSQAGLTLPGSAVVSRQALVQ